MKIILKKSIEELNAMSNAEILKFDTERKAERIRLRNRVRKLKKQNKNHDDAQIEYDNYDRECERFAAYTRRFRDPIFS